MDASIHARGNLLDSNLLNSVLTDNSMTIRWYPARRCSCWGNIDGVMQATGAPDPSCPICHGQGRFYDTYQNVTGVGLDGMENMAAWDAESGVNYVGAIRMFVPYLVNGQVVPLYQQGTLNDLIWAEDILLTTRTMAKRGIDETREHPVGPVGITWGTTTYQEGVDYRTSGKSITWLSEGPPSGTSYEATYAFHPWFSIMEGMPIARNFSHMNLPRRFTLQLTPELGENFRGN